MPGEKQPSQAELNGINDTLEASLRSCRSVVENYKSLLEGGAAVGLADDDTQADPAPDASEEEQD